MTTHDGRHRPPTLRSRVAATGVSVLAVWVVILTVLVNLLVAAQLRSQAGDVIRARAQAAATTVVVTPTGRVTIRDTAPDAAIDVGTWVFEGTKTIEKPRGGASLEPQARSMAGVGPRITESDGILWYADPIMADGVQVATVVTSLSLSPYESTRRLLAAGTTVLALLLLAAVWVTLLRGVGRALKPVAEMTHQSARWSADDVDRRFGTDDRPAELEDLAATLDGLLDRLSAVLRHEQQLSSEISHELRTPLARILAEVELHRQRLRPGDPLDASLGVVQSSAQEMSQILETLMAAARSGSGTAPGRCDAAAVLRDLVAARRTPDRVVEVVAPGPVATGVDAEVLVRAVSPVLDNALRFSRREVVVHVATERQVVVITVVDDGPGISDEDLPHVFEPGRRGTGPDPHPGAGLGMSLSRRLIKAAGGSIEATSTDSGALIIIRLPAA